MSLRRHQQAWEDLGRVDPMWAVLTIAALRHGKWDPGEFFATGEREIRSLMGSAAELGLPRSGGTALDFGCGLGRLTRPLASHFEKAVGVDISEPMIAQARKWHADCKRCSFVVNTGEDLRSFEDSSVDLIYSRYVLQHLPSGRLVGRYLREFVRVLRPAGLLVFQLPSHIALLHRLQPRRRLYALLRALGVNERVLLGTLELTPMRMRGMPEAAVTRLLGTLGGRVLRVDRVSDLDHVYFVTH
jgi:SAM-dependent methyltransferase